jgi:hypothetical protein
MSGRLGNYWELVKAAEQARVTITKAQQKQIAGLYQEISDDLNHRLQRYNPDSLTYRWVKDYAQSLQKDSKRLYTVIKAGVADSLLQSAKAPVKAEQTFYSKLAPELSEHFSDVFSRVPQSAADELMSGGIYKDFSGLSERIWNYRKKYNRDIQTVIVKGIEAQKSAFDLAKDLEMYVDPKAAKPWNWNIVYPGVNQVVDYNAQRLSRTAVTHAYQLSFERATKDNPFVESYKWHSSHGARMCELCAQRDGRIYQKDALPFDHPNGMCTVTAVIPKSYDEIGQELGDWAAGKSDNPELDKWLGNSVAESKKRDIIKSIDIDDFELLADTHKISPEVSNVISNTIHEYEQAGGMYISEAKFGDFYDEMSGKPALFQVYPNEYGSININVNSRILAGMSIEEIDKKIASTAINLPSNLKEAIIHECGHAKSYYGKSISEIKEMNKNLLTKGVKGISKIAETDGAECIAEVEVLLSRESKVPPEAMKLYIENVKEANL